MAIALTLYQVYLITILAIAAILYFYRYRRLNNGIFRLVALVGKLSLAFFVVIDMILPQLGITAQIYPDPLSIILIIGIIFLEDFKADRGVPPKSKKRKGARNKT